MKNTKGKLYLVAMSPLIPLLFLIDLAVGDLIVGIKTTTKEKLRYHVEIIKETWSGENDF